jgi:hypothetical protein
MQPAALHGGGARVVAVGLYKLNPVVPYLEKRRGLPLTHLEGRLVSTTLEPEK